MFEDLRGKVVLVTGASTGIGAAAASAFGAAGAKVAVHYNASADAAKEVVASIVGGGGEAQAFRANATQSEALDQLLDADVVARLGRIDVLVNNAGDLFGRRAFADADDTFLDELLSLNVRSVVHLSRAILPVFKRQGSGNIINVTSIAARNGGGTGRRSSMRRPRASSAR